MSYYWVWESKSPIQYWSGIKNRFENYIKLLDSQHRQPAVAVHNKCEERHFVDKSPMFLIDQSMTICWRVLQS